MQKSYLLFGAKADAKVEHLGSFVDDDAVANMVDAMLRVGYRSLLCYDELTGKVAMFTVDDLEEDEPEDVGFVFDELEDDESED